MGLIPVLQRVGLEGGLDSVQSELTSVRTDKEEVVRNVQALEEQVEDLKVINPFNAEATLVQAQGRNYF